MKKFLIALLTLAAFACVNASAEDAVACIGKVVPSARVSKLAAYSPSGAQAIVKELFVKKGDILERGAVVASIEGVSRAQAALERAKAELEAVRAASAVRVLQQKNIVADLEGTFAQNAKVIDEKDPPRREREQIEYEQESLARKIAQAKAMQTLVEANEAAVLKQAAAAEAEARIFYDSHFVRTPISGEVIECHANPGEDVGMDGLCEIVNTASMYVDAEVYISDISKVKAGDAAEIFSDALGKEKFTGKVVQVSGYVRTNKMFSADPSDFSNLKVVIAKIKLDNPEKFRSLVGAQVNVRILVK